MNLLKILKNLMGFSVAPIVTAVLSFLLIPIISRIFPTDQYGYINVFYTTTTILSSVFLCGFNDCYQRFYFENVHDVNHRKAIMTLAIIISLLLDVIFLVVLMLFSEFFGRALFNESNRGVLLALVICTESQSLFALLMLEARMQYNHLRYNLQQVLQFFALRISIVFVSCYSVKYNYSIYTMTLIMFFVMIIYLIERRKQLPEKVIGCLGLSKNQIREYLNYGVPAMLATIAVTINGSISKFLMAGNEMASEAGIFSIAMSLAFSISFISASFRNYWAPFMFENYNTEAVIIKKMHNYVLLISILFMLAIFLVQDILYLIVGESYRISQSYFMLLMFNQVQAFICETTSYGILIEKKSKYNMIILLIALALNVSVSAFLIPNWGGLGASIGVFVASIVILLSKTIIGQKYYSSIGSVRKTTFSIGIILLVCCTNIWLYNHLSIRIYGAMAIFCVVFAVYRREVIDTIVFAKRIIRRKK